MLAFLGRMLNEVIGNLVKLCLVLQQNADCYSIQIQLVFRKMHFQYRIIENHTQPKDRDCFLLSLVRSSSQTFFLQDQMLHFVF